MINLISVIAVKSNFSTLKIGYIISGIAYWFIFIRGSYFMYKNFLITLCCFGVGMLSASDSSRNTSPVRPATPPDQLRRQQLSQPPCLEAKHTSVRGQAQKRERTGEAIAVVPTLVLAADAAAAAVLCTPPRRARPAAAAVSHDPAAWVAPEAFCDMIQRPAMLPAAAAAAAPMPGQPIQGALLALLRRIENPDTQASDRPAL